MFMSRPASCRRSWRSRGSRSRRHSRRCLASQKFIPGPNEIWRSADCRCAMTFSTMNRSHEIACCLQRQATARKSPEHNDVCTQEDRKIDWVWYPGAHTVREYTQTATSSHAMHFFKYLKNSRCTIGLQIQPANGQEGLGQAGHAMLAVRMFSGKPDLQLLSLKRIHAGICPIADAG